MRKAKNVFNESYICPMPAFHSFLPLPWQKALAPYLSTTEATLLEQRVAAAYQSERVFPEAPKLFRAFELCPPENTKVVLVGQDPYIHPGQAMGLSFSVPDEFPLPPSLRNIYKNLAVQFGHAPATGNLEPWARQGVLLLNTILTVAAGTSLSHKKMGWESFTHQVLTHLNQKSPVVFMLWGNPAKKLIPRLTNPRNLVLTTSHPSPLGVHKGFASSRHFEEANAFLVKNGQGPIDWVPENPLMR